MHASRDAAAHIRSRRAQARQLGERDRKVDFGSALGQAVDLERTSTRAATWGAYNRYRVCPSQNPLAPKPLFLEDDSEAGVTSAPPLILASTSRYRRALLERLGVAFACEPPGVDEAPLPQELPIDRALRLALAKAQAVAVRHPEALVIGSDQVAAAGDALLDKPGERGALRASSRA